MASKQPILDLLLNSQIFMVNLSDDKTKLVFMYTGDYYFEANLDKESALQLIEELKELVEQMK